MIKTKNFPYEKAYEKEKLDLKKRKFLVTIDFCYKLGVIFSVIYLGTFQNVPYDVSYDKLMVKNTFQKVT